MAIYSYQLAGGQTRWMFTIDLPPAADGKRRQMNRKGFKSEAAAIAAETEARHSFARADLASDGSPAHESFAHAQQELFDARVALGRIGTNLNQAVASLNATGQPPEWLERVVLLCERRMQRLDEVIERVDRRLP